MATWTKARLLSKMLPRYPNLDDFNTVYRSPAAVAKECGRILGDVVQQMSSVVVGQSWQQLIYCKYFMTLGLNTGKESGSLTMMVGREVSISLDACERCGKRASSRRKSIDEVEGFLNRH